MATLSNNNQTVDFNFGGSLDAWQVQDICAGNAGNRASDEQIKEYLLDEGWEEDHANEFIEFANSDLIKKMKF